MRDSLPVLDRICGCLLPPVFHDKSEKPTFEYRVNFQHPGVLLNGSFSMLHNLPRIVLCISGLSDDSGCTWILWNYILLPCYLHVEAEGLMQSDT